MNPKPLSGPRGQADSAQSANVDPEYYGWFRAANKGVPESRFQDVTMEIDLSDVTSADVNVEIVVEESLPPVLPQPVHRTSTPLPAGARRDERFSDLNTILREARVILTEKYGMSETDVDTVEWQLRTKIATL